MGREKLFPPQEKTDGQDDRTPHERFSDLATRVLRVPKSEIDKRERKWERKRDYGS